MAKLEQPYSSVGQSLNDMKERFRRGTLKAEQRNALLLAEKKKKKEKNRKTKKNEK